MSIETVTINHYRSLDAGSFIKSGQLTFSQLIDYLSNYYINDKNKYAGGLFVASEMSDPYRVNKNILNKTCITMDFDEIPSDFNLIEYFKNNFKNSYIIYSTWSHTEEQQRMRIVIPLSKPLPNEYYAAAIEMYEKVIGFPCDDKSKVLSQAMAKPVIKHENAHRIFEVQDTSFTDTDKLIELIKRQQPEEDKPLFSRRDEEYWNICFAGLVEGDNRNNSLASITGLLMQRGVPITAVWGLTACWNECNVDKLSTKEYERTVSSIIKKEINRRGG